MKLDMQTVLLIYFLCHLLVTAFLVSVWMQNHKHFKGLHYWILNYVIQSVGVALLYGRGYIPAPVSVVLGNALLFAGNIVMINGLALFVGTRTTPIFSIAASALAVTAMSYFYFIDDNLNTRIIFGSIPLLLMSLQGFFVLTRKSAREDRPALRPLALVFLLYAMEVIARLVVACVAPVSRHVDLPDAPTSQAIFVLLYIILMLCHAFFLYNVVVRRLLAALDVHQKEREHSETIRLLRDRLLDGDEFESQEKVLREVLDQALVSSGSSYAAFIGVSPNGVSPRVFILPSLPVSRSHQNLLSPELSGALAGQNHRWQRCLREAQVVVFDSQPKNLLRATTVVVPEFSENGICIPVRTKDGITAIFELSGKLGGYGDDDIADLVQIAQLGWEIAERRRTIQDLRLSEHKYRTLIEHARDGILILDPAGLVLDLNACMEELLGYSRGELTQTRFQNMVEPGPFLMGLTALNSSGAFIQEISLKRRDGTPVSVEVNASLLEDGRILAIIRDLSQRIRADSELRKALQEKETLLRELYHRTKNNMSVLIALLQMQSSFSGDEKLKHAFQEAENRIHSMAMVHQKLYEAKDLSRINLKEYFTSLVDLLQRSYGISRSRVRFEDRMEDVFVLIDTAIPAGLILNEVLSNSFKYAFPEGRSGCITVSLRRVEEARIELILADDGQGFPPGFDHRRDGHMGLQTVMALAENQLLARFSVESGAGVSCKLVFRDDLYAARV